MPSSLPELIPYVLCIMEAMRPKSILDIGFGRGKYGLLAYEYVPGLEIIDGLEAHAPYTTPDYIWEIYDQVYWMDIGSEIASVLYDKYDMYLLIDVIEHLPKEEGKWLLSQLKGHIVVTTPEGWMPQGAVDGNPYEKHRSAWTEQDFVHLKVKRLWRVRGNLVLHIDNREEEQC